MKQVGIWIDKRTAHIIAQDNGGGKQDMKVVISKIEEYNIAGGSGTKFKGGPQNVVQDSKYLEREKHQTKAYFNEVAKQLTDADQIVIFGPAEMPPKLQKELVENNPRIASKIMEVSTADSMTKAQMKAWVSDYFSKSSPKLGR